jgi:hypothetical protein
MGNKQKEIPPAWRPCGALGQPLHIRIHADVGFFRPVMKVARAPSALDHVSSALAHAARAASQPSFRLSSSHLSASISAAWLYVDRYSEPADIHWR